MTPPNEPITLRSHRLELCELPLHDATDVVAGRTPLGQRWADGYPLDGTIAAAKMLLRAAAAGSLREGFGMYQIVEADSGLTVGDIGFHAPPDEAGRAEIGYGICPAFRGRGLVSHALRMLVKWTFEQPGIQELVAQTEEGHVASRRVLDAAGFALVAVSDGMCRYRAMRPHEGL